jgi:hypothetical protein
MTDRDLSEALERIEEIHNHLAKGETYLGYRPIPVAASGLAGLLAAWLQPRFIPVPTAQSFVMYWLAAAAACAFLAAVGVQIHFVRDCDRFERRRTLHVWGQFIPCLVAGLLAGCAVVRVAPESVGLLPGFWTVLVSLGIFSSRPFLPRATGWIGLYFLAAGIWLLLHPLSLQSPSMWPLAGIFAVGQLASAVMLYFNIERKPDADA